MNRFAKFKRRAPGGRNRVEAAYEAYLEVLKRAGEIVDYKFEGIKLRLADNTFYTPDFLVFAKDDVVELHDTKGTTTKTRSSGEKVKAPWVEEDAKLKIKLVAELYPFRTYIVFKNGNAWEKQAF